MFKLIFYFVVIVFLSACGVDTSSSTTQIEDNEPIIVVEEKQIEDLDLIISNPIYVDTIDDGNISESNESNVTDEEVVEGIPNDGTSIFDTVGALEDPYGCMIGNPVNGFTDKVLKDDSVDAQTTTDSEYGIGANSRFPIKDILEETQITVYYQALKPARNMKMVSIYESLYRIDIDTAWANNDVNTIYVRTPKDENDLYSCYKYDLNNIELAGTTIGVKVYRKEL